MKKSKEDNIMPGKLIKCDLSEKTVRLVLPDVDLDKKTGVELMKLGKSDLWALVSPLHDLLKDSNLEFAAGSSSSICNIMKNLVYYGAAARFYKEDYAKIYISFTSDLSNILNIIKADSKLKICWRTIINAVEVSSSTIETFVGRKLEWRSGRSWYSPIFMECDFFPLDVSEGGTCYYYSSERYNRNYSLSLCTGMREMLAKLLLGKESVEAAVVDKMPEEENLQIMDFEDVISSDLLFLSGLGMTGSPLTASKGTITAARLKSIKKQFITKEFPEMGKEYPLDRVELLTSSYFLLKETNKNSSPTTNPERFCKKVLKSMASKLNGALFEMFLPAFKGFTKAWTENSCPMDVTERVKTLLIPAADGWMSLSNLRLRYLSCPSKVTGVGGKYSYLFAESGRYKSTLKRKSDNMSYFDRRSADIQWFNEVDFPFVLHWTEFLCALGMLEIAYVIPSDREDKDPLEGLRYVRLTSLGRYAFGIDAEYCGYVTKNPYDFDYDDENSILTIIGGNCPYALFLKTISETIGNTRFRITPESLVKDCQSRKELEERISNLGKIVIIDNYSNLKSIVDKALQRTECVDKVKGSYKMFRVTRKLPGFISLIISNKEIRENCIMAENSTILVKTAFLMKFKTICERHGYIVEV